MDAMFNEGHALVVGVGADLPNTVDDASGLAAILQDPRRCAYPLSQVMLLTGAQATRGQVLRALEGLAQSTSPAATVVFFFSGHGYRIDLCNGKLYYLLPFGYDPDRLEQTAISGAELSARLHAIPAKKLLVLLDCCHAGGIDVTVTTGLQMVKAPLPPEMPDLLSQGTGRVLLASCKENELSYAGKPYSAFTLALVEGLCGQGVARQDGYVRVADLALHARQMVPSRTKDRQHPILHFQHADNFAVAYYAGGDGQPKALPFTKEPMIEPVPGFWRGFGQFGPQTGPTGVIRTTGFVADIQRPDAIDGSSRSNVSARHTVTHLNADAPGNVSEQQGYLHSISPDLQVARVSNLPPKTYHRLVGRTDEVDQVISVLSDSRRKSIVAIAGLGGIGKTALAREVVDHFEKERSFTHTVWASAKPDILIGDRVVTTGVAGYGVEELLSDIGRQCGRLDIAKMWPEQRRSAVENLLHAVSVLIVMDNMETVSDGDLLIDEIFNILGRSKLLITSRRRYSHDQVRTIPLQGLGTDMSMQFIREESKERGISLVAEASNRTLAKIHKATGGAPLAMKLVIGQMSRLSMDRVLYNLKQARFTGPDYDFYHFVFKQSWDLLSTDSRKLLISMGAFAPGIGGTEEAVKSTSSIPEPSFSAALDELVLMSLVESLGDVENRRYSIHQLTDNFVRSNIVQEWSFSEEDSIPLEDDR